MSNGPIKSRRIVQAVALATLALTGNALAQEEFKGLEEVVVTASKRAQTLQETGMSITALTDVELERMGAASFLDFAVRVPNLAIAFEADGRFDSNSPAIRGIFGQDTTGFYIDDTLVNASVLPKVLDVERVEVLRGPQGSLYGARSMGGTIRMITKQPDLQEVHGSVHSSVSSVKDGDINHVVDGAINIPVIPDVFALRLAAYAGANSGVFDREYQPTWIEAGTGAVRQNPGAPFATRENVDDEDYWGVQLVGKWMLTERLSFIPKFLYQEIDADGLPLADIEPDNTTELRFYDVPENGSDEWYIASGTFNWELDKGTVVSTTSLFDRTTDENEEQGSFIHWLFNNVIEIPIDPLFGQINTQSEYEFVAHETRFASEFDGPWQFSGGIFYQDTEYRRIYPPALIPGINSAVNDFIGVPIDIVPGDLIFETLEVFDTREWAVFGELTYSVNERLSLTAGGRFYDTETEFVATSDGFANDGFSQETGEQDESGFNPKVLVEYDINDNVNMYASGAKGFRIGGVNGNLPLGLCGEELADLNIDPSATPTFDSDELWSYEIGFKSTFADNRISVNAAAYFIDWTDIQQLNRLACGFQFTANAGEAESQGFEVEINAAPMEGLTLSLGVGYTDAEITDDGGVPGVRVGDKIQGIPEWTVTASAQYIFSLGGGWDGLVRADGNHYGESFSANNATSLADARVRDAWEQLNLRAGVMNDDWEVTLFATNVNDERANLADNRSIAAETPGRQRLVTTRPRTVGLEARYRF